ncbi:Protein of unknown function (DUF3047) [Burkholderiales bacterium JOSHI_001]|nr:Protein of unknown function (DUF3047) [Burkholderiales bacterium JOSHI_001]
MTPLQGLWRLVACACLLVAPAGHALPLLPLSALADADAVAAPPSPWQVVGLPQQHKPLTRFQVVMLEGQPALRVSANASYGNLMHPFPAQTPAGRLAWRWRVEEPNAQADLLHRQGDDSAIKVCAAFDLPDSAVPFVERQLLRLARLRSGEHLPAATVCYVWDEHLALGTALDNAYTRRVRLIVLRGPGTPLHAWMAERRDLRADFLRLFGDESTEVPPLQALVLSADADNTRGHSLAHVADLNLE